MSGGRARPRLGLVIPNYQDADLLLQTLESVRELEDVEVIVVDDASPDPEVAPRLHEYEQRGLIDILIIKSVNAGASLACNDGARAATAAYLFFFSNDDLLMPGALAVLGDALDSNPECDFAMGHFEYFGARAGLRRSAPWDPWRAITRCAWTGAYMVRREIFLELGGLKDRCIAQDWDMYQTFAEGGHRGYVWDGVVFRYRIQRGGTRLSHAARNNYKHEVRALRQAHPELYADERLLRSRSDAGVVEKIFWTLLTRIGPHRPGWLTEAYFWMAAGGDAVRARLGAGVPVAPTGGRVT